MGDFKGGGEQVRTERGREGGRRREAQEKGKNMDYTMQELNVQREKCKEYRKAWVMLTEGRERGVLKEAILCISWFLLP